MEMSCGAGKVQISSAQRRPGRQPAGQGCDQEEAFCGSFHRVTNGCGEPWWPSTDKGLSHTRLFGWAAPVQARACFGRSRSDDAPRFVCACHAGTGCRRRRCEGRRKAGAGCGERLSRSRSANRWSNAAKECREADDGKLTPAPDMVRKIDLTGDGRDDYIVSFEDMKCSTFESIFCGTGGCLFEIYVTLGDGSLRSVFSDPVREYKILPGEGGSHHSVRHARLATAAPMAPPNAQEAAHHRQAVHVQGPIGYDRKNAVRVDAACCARRRRPLRRMQHSAAVQGDRLSDRGPQGAEPMRRSNADARAAAR